MYIYIEIKFGFNLERDKIAQFLQTIGIKLRQKLKYWNQIETKEITYSITVTRDTIIVTSHYHCYVARCQFDKWQIFNCFFNFKKNSKNPGTDIWHLI